MLDDIYNVSKVCGYVNRALAHITVSFLNISIDSSFQLYKRGRNNHL